MTTVSDTISMPLGTHRLFEFVMLTGSFVLNRSQS